MDLPDIVTICLYGGSCDGCFIQAHSKQGTFRVKYAVLPNADGTHRVCMDVKPGMEISHADYVASREWSLFFGRRTAVPVGFPSKPPRENAAA